MKRPGLVALGTVLSVLHAGEALAEHASRDGGIAGLASVFIEDVPHLRQQPDFCGEACVAMALRQRGQAFDREDVLDRTGVDPRLGRGAYVWAHATQRMSAQQIQSTVCTAAAAPR